MSTVQFGWQHYVKDSQHCPCDTKGNLTSVAEDYTRFETIFADHKRKSIEKI